MRIPKLELRKVAERLNLGPGVDLDQLMLMLNQSHQTELLKAIVAGESALAGSAQELESLRNELAFLAFKVVKLGKAASTLEALQKDHLVAEAVFTSRAARLDISRSDLFSSYPIVQVLTTPDLPESRSQPRARYAVAAGLLGTFLILLAWGATWVRGRFNQRR